jgi:hypothetical protein
MVVLCYGEPGIPDAESYILYQGRSLGRVIINAHAHHWTPLLQDH